MLCCRQADSSAARVFARRWRRPIVWWGMPVEARAAFARLVREGALSAGERAQALARLEVLRRASAEIQPTEALRAIAEDLPDRLQLRAADALQLAAALVYCGQKPRRCTFVCFDARLGKAAEELGFTVTPRSP